MTWSRSILISAVATLLACSSSSSDGGTPPADGSVTPDGGGVTADQACAEFIKAQCDKIASCSSFFMQVTYGDAAKCAERVKLICNGAFDAPNTSLTPARGLECANAVKGVSCPDIFADNTPKACIPDPGKGADGSACGDNWQCVSTFCAKSAGSHCGKCTPLPAAGAACVDGSCGGRGLVCANKICVKAGVSGDTCTADGKQPCAAGLACFSGKCTKGGAAGAKCDPAGMTDPVCDLTLGLACNPTTKVCQTLAIANAGSACGFVGGEFKVCGAGSKCVGSMGTTPGTCIAPAADGAACDTTKGPGCLEPAACIDKICKLPDAKSCK